MSAFFGRRLHELLPLFPLLLYHCSHRPTVPLIFLPRKRAAHLISAQQSTACYSQTRRDKFPINTKGAHACAIFCAVRGLCPRRTRSLSVVVWPLDRASGRLRKYTVKYACAPRTRISKGMWCVNRCAVAWFMAACIWRDNFQPKLEAIPDATPSTDCDFIYGWKHLLSMALIN